MCDSTEESAQLFNVTKKNYGSHPLLLTRLRYIVLYDFMAFRCDVDSNDFMSYHVNISDEYY